MIFQLSVIVICVGVGLIGLLRASRLLSWLRMDGQVVSAADGSVDSSAALVVYTDPEGVRREFISNLRFGHSFLTPRKKRIPYHKGQRVGIWVNPKDYSQAELRSGLALGIPLLLLFFSVYLLVDLLRRN